MTPYLFCLVWVLAQWAMGMKVCLTPDSLSYIDFSATRTAGYPAFLWLIKNLTGSYNWVPHIQLALLWASVGYVAHGLPNYLRWPWVLGILATSFAMKQYYSFEIMTESLFVTLLLTLAGLILHRSSVAWVGLCMGMLILIRPSAYALLPGLLFYIWHQRQSWLQTILPIIGCILLGVGAQGMHNGVWSTQSFLGHNLIGKVVFVIRPDMSSTNNEENIFIQRLSAYMSPIQQAVDQVPQDPSAIIYVLLFTTLFALANWKKLKAICLFPRIHMTLSGAILPLKSSNRTPSGISKMYG